MRDPKFNEIKYRLFDKDKNITKIYTLSKLINTTFRKGNFEYRGTFSGLKDKNRVEIYEGDIVDSDVGIGEIAWNKTGLSLFSLPRETSRGIFAISYHAVKIIGNIYENPELLK